MKVEIVIDVDRKSAFVKSFHAYIGDMRNHRVYAQEEIEDSYMSINDASEEFGNLLASLLI